MLSRKIFENLHIAFVILVLFVQKDSAVIIHRFSCHHQLRMQGSTTCSFVLPCIHC